MHFRILNNIPLLIFLYIYAKHVQKQKITELSYNHHKIITELSHNHHKIHPQIPIHVVASACDIIKKQKFTPYFNISGKILKATVEQCDPAYLKCDAYEASSMISYIIKNYEKLPKKIIFIHAHDLAGSQYPRNITGQVSTLVETDYFKKNEYGDVFPHKINRPIYNCTVNCTYPKKIPLYREDMVEMFAHVINGTKFMDTYLKTISGCKGHVSVTRSSTFFVTSNRLLKYPKKDYERFLDNIHNYIMARGGTKRQSYRVSEAIERSWQLLFGEKCGGDVFPPSLGKMNVVWCC
ncbi:hypothetical protein TRFO_10766 [Tritrichomonas foetus]|uniref:Uncharacterized protein n=1 Tax=Tritrichomonas foetus TaxID=1144522 RepID=A0A1J4JBN8_9EUKA|nr:hypothetical protein TRFO_10766 [Tritrichomonas foetus]|eukprot:OHS94853.1 hypothetical protein TRFO_10766 [Tritrichomonas foetus]